jgi:hypothetical protein
MLQHLWPKARPQRPIRRILAKRCSLTETAWPIHSLPEFLNSEHFNLLLGGSPVHFTGRDLREREKMIITRSALACLASCLAVVGCSSLAHGAIITYTNRATWTSAVAAVNFTVDFESFVTDTSFATVPLNVGPFTLSTVGTASFGTNFIDVSPFVTVGIPASFGNANASFFVQSPLAAGLTFATPVHGFFADFLFAGNGTQLDLTLAFSGGGTADVLVPGFGTDLVPFGFVSTGAAVTSIIFNNTVNDGFNLDNISGAQSLPTPEPASLSLLALGAIGFLRRPRARHI